MNKCFNKHSSLKSALSIFSEYYPQVTDRVGKDLNLLLKGIHSSQRLQYAWKSSLLTGNRFPVELAFSSSGNSIIRYCTEIDSPEVDTKTRLDLAFRLLDELGAPQFDEHFMATCKEI